MYKYKIESSRLLERRSTDSWESIIWRKYYSISILKIVDLSFGYLNYLLDFVINFLRQIGKLFIDIILIRIYCRVNSVIIKIS